MEAFTSRISLLNLYNAMKSFKNLLKKVIFCFPGTKSLIPLKGLWGHFKRPPATAQRTQEHGDQDSDARDLLFVVKEYAKQQADGTAKEGKTEEHCRNVEPDLREVQPGRHVACWYAAGYETNE